MDDKPIVCFEQEYFPEDELDLWRPAHTVEREGELYVVEGPKIEKMLGHTKPDSLLLKWFAFFQFLKDSVSWNDLEQVYSGRRENNG